MTNKYGGGTNIKKFLSIVLLFLFILPVNAIDSTSVDIKPKLDNELSIVYSTNSSVLVKEVKIFIAGYFVAQIIDGIVYNGTGYYPQDITNSAIAKATDFALYNIYQHVALSTSILANFSKTGVFINATGGFGGGGGTTWSIEY